MASSNVRMASTSNPTPDLPRQSSVCSISTIIADLHRSDPSRNLVSMSMDDLLKNIYSDAQSHDQAQPEELELEEEEDPVVGSASFPATRTVDEVWKEIVAGDGDRPRDASVDQEITLEDFLSKAGAVHEERVPVISDSLDDQFRVPSQQLVAIDGGRMVGVGRGKRRAVEEPVDKATQQKQRRMIKNRESAARSRERKQAYTLELESIVTNLEEENAQLLREEYLGQAVGLIVLMEVSATQGDDFQVMHAEHIKERSKQLKEKIIPITEKQRPRRVLKRVNSLSW